MTPIAITIQAFFPLWLAGMLCIAPKQPRDNRRIVFFAVAWLVVLLLAQLQWSLWLLTPEASDKAPLIMALFAMIAVLSGMYALVRVQSSAFQIQGIGGLWLGVLSFILSREWWLLWFEVDAQHWQGRTENLTSYTFWAIQAFVWLLLIVSVCYQHRWMPGSRQMLYRLSVIFLTAECLTQIYFFTQAYWIPYFLTLQEWQIVFPSNPWYWWMPFLERFAGFRTQSDVLHTTGLVLYYSIVTWRILLDKQGLRRKVSTSGRYR